VSDVESNRLETRASSYLVSNISDPNNSADAQVVLVRLSCSIVVLGENHRFVLKKKVLDEGDATVMIEIDVGNLHHSLVVGPLNEAMLLKEVCSLHQIHFSALILTDGVLERLVENVDFLPIIPQSEDKAFEEHLLLLFWRLLAEFIQLPSQLLVRSFRSLRF